jgi:hypothetical protein
MYIWSISFHNYLSLSAAGKGVGVIPLRRIIVLHVRDIYITWIPQFPLESSYFYVRGQSMNNKYVKIKN